MGGREGGREGGRAYLQGGEINLHTLEQVLELGQDLGVI